MFLIQPSFVKMLDNRGSTVWSFYTVCDDITFFVNKHCAHQPENCWRAGGSGENNKGLGLSDTIPEEYSLQLYI